MEKFESNIRKEAVEPSLPEVAAEMTASDKGVVNKIRKLIDSRVQESKMPTKEGLGYESTMGVYGGKLVKDSEGRLVYDTKGFWSKIDQWGDRILRAFDEHHARKPGAMFSRRPINFLKLLPFIVDSKRYRGTPEQTMANVRRFGLEEYYGAHPSGIEVKKPDLFSHAIGLQDIFRQDQINHPALSAIDRFDALGKATDYMRALHEKAGGIAEGNLYTFLFTEKNGGEVAKPILIIPTEIYNPEKHVPDTEQKATDLLDLLASTTAEEYRRSHDWESVKKVLGVILTHYHDKKVISAVSSFVKRGRLTLPGDIEGLNFETSPTYRASRRVFAAHNTQRLTIKNPEVAPQMRHEITEACDSYINYLASLPSEMRTEIDERS
ncbi:MAG: hypothetical protein Q8P97_02510 [bacterium]|nr:hypothetical protein [bacterium]